MVCIGIGTRFRCDSIGTFLHNIGYPHNPDTVHLRQSTGVVAPFDPAPITATRNICSPFRVASPAVQRSPYPRSSKPTTALTTACRADTGEQALSESGFYLSAELAWRLHEPWLLLHLVDKCQHILQGDIALHGVGRREDVPTVSPLLDQVLRLPPYIVNSPEG